MLRNAIVLRAVWSEEDTNPCRSQNLMCLYLCWLPDQPVHEGSCLYVMACSTWLSQLSNMCQCICLTACNTKQCNIWVSGTSIVACLGLLRSMHRALQTRTLLLTTYPQYSNCTVFAKHHLGVEVDSFSVKSIKLVRTCLNMHSCRLYPCLYREHIAWMLLLSVYMNAHWRCFAYQLTLRHSVETEVLLCSTECKHRLSIGGLVIHNYQDSPY